MNTPDHASEGQQIPGCNLKCKLQGPPSGIYRFAWSPDGQSFVSLSKRGTVQFWNIENGSVLREIEGRARRILSTAWSQNGRTLAISNSELIQLWNIENGTLIRSFKDTQHLVTSMAWSPNGDILASAHNDGTLLLWDSRYGNVSRRLKGHTQTIINVMWSPDGRLLISSSYDGTVRFWHPDTGNDVLTIKLPHAATSTAWFADTKLLATGISQSIHLWDTNDGRELSVIEGHTDVVTGLSFSGDGKLLASVSQDNTVRLWNCKNWELINSINIEQTRDSDSQYVSFNPKLYFLATLGDGGQSIYIWELNPELLFAKVPSSESIHYTTAKIALVGDSGVGKTGIGWRLAHGEFKEHPSTHGQQFWVLDELSTIREDGTECEAVLWDLAGQPDYRLIHALFLDDVDLALIVFDPTNQQELLKGVEFWLKQLSHRKGRPCRTILVGGRADRGSLTITPDDLTAFCRHHDIDGGYTLTSARTGEGIAELLEQIKRQVAWNEMVATITTSTFKRIKEYLLNLKEDINRKNVLVSPQDLRNYLIATDSNWAFSNAEMMTAVKHLNNHGYVTLLYTSSGKEMILLAPDLLTNLASSFVLDARRHSKGLGVLDEANVLSGNYSFPELQSFDEQERETLIDAVTILFLQHNVCFRETLGNQTLLVFPSLINLKRPLVEETETADSFSYIASGAVENVYAALVVLLGYTNTFTRVNQWQGQAQYQMDRGEICGFRLAQEREGEIELVLYYGINVPEYTRSLFQGLFERFLRSRNVTTAKFPPVPCQHCGYLQERTAVIKRVRAGKSFIYCDDCGEKIELKIADDDINLNFLDRVKLEREQVLTRLRTTFEAALVRVKAFVRDKKSGTFSPPRCFISYAWGTLDHQRWVSRLSTDLKKAGVEITLDQWDNSDIGANIARFLSEIEVSDFILVVGTRLYKQKYENKLSSAGSKVAAEVDLINIRLTGTEEQKRTILPLLLQGNDKTSFPPLLQGRIYGDFRQEGNYFATLFDLILKLYEIHYNDVAFIDLREALRSEQGILERWEVHSDLTLIDESDIPTS